MRSALIATLLILPIAAYAQAPAAGSGGGGNVGPSVATPTTPQGKAPPGTPTAETTGEQALRTAASKDVIGKTETPDPTIPGNTTAPDTGATK